MNATLRYLRITPRKTRLVANLVRGKAVGEALNILQFTKKSASQPLYKLIQSAIANAEQRGEVNIDALFVKTLMVDEGPQLRRFMPRAMGRATRINKKTSHVFCVLGTR